MGFLRRPKSTDHAAVTSAIERVNMSEFRLRQIGELSGGQRKRVFLARAIAQEGKVILLDEPFTGVDPQPWLGPRVLRPNGFGQRNRDCLWSDRDDIYPRKS